MFGPLVPYLLFHAFRIHAKSFQQQTGTTIHMVLNLKKFYNIEDNYFTVFHVSFFGCCAIIYAFVVIDTSFVIFLQHACGMFRILM